jgi:peptidoglycan hydrolase-like protein with peptidoglycan-binding domain
MFNLGKGRPEQPVRRSRTDAGPWEERNMNPIATAAVLAVCAVPVFSSAAPLNPPVYVQELTPRDIHDIQARLHALGFYGGRINGVWGQDTQVALQRLQRSRGLQVTGQLNPATVAALGVDLGVPGTEGVGTSQPSNQPASPAAVRAVQERLAGLGFYSGSVDGVWGKSTEESVRRFQQNRGLQPSGQLTVPTLSAMGLDPNNLTAHGTAP